MTQMPRVDVEKRGEMYIVTLPPGSISDEVQIDYIRSRLLDLKGVRVIVDLSGVTFVSSSLLTALVALNKKIQRAQRTLILCSVHPEIMEILKMTRLCNVFIICENLEDALECC